MKNRWGRAWRGLGIAAAALAATAPGLAGASPVAGAPVGIAAASLRQQGIQLQLSATLTRPLRSVRLGARGQSLCLLIERPVSRAVREQLCLTRAGRPPLLRLELARVSAAGTGPGRPVPGSIVAAGGSSFTATLPAASAAISFHRLRWQLQSAAAPGSCTPGTGSPCTVLAPAEPTLLRLHTPRLVGCTAAGPSLVYGGSSRRREIALTLDDGPWPDPPTMDFVRLLARLHAPATFFEIGDQIGTYDPHGAIERAMLADGDMIGDHTWTHPDMVSLSRSAQRAQLVSTAAAIHHATGFQPCLWRPPYGALSPELVSLARSLGLLTAYWNIDPRDWSLPGVASIERTVIDNARNGGIAELHFGGGPRFQTLAALPDIVRTLRRRGYRFVTLTQMLGLRLIYR